MFLVVIIFALGYAAGAVSLWLLLKSTAGDDSGKPSSAELAKRSAYRRFYTTK